MSEDIISGHIHSVIPQRPQQHTVVSPGSSQLCPQGWIDAADDPSYVPWQESPGLRTARRSGEGGANGPPAGCAMARGLRGGCGTVAQWTNALQPGCTVQRAVFAAGDCRGHPTARRKQPTAASSLTAPLPPAPHRPHAPSRPHCRRHPTAHTHPDSPTAARTLTARAAAAPRGDPWSAPRYPQARNNPPDAPSAVSR